jgi:hypothetical protein
MYSKYSKATHQSDGQTSSSAFPNFFWQTSARGPNIWKILSTLCDVTWGAGMQIFGHIFKLKHSNSDCFTGLLYSNRRPFWARCRWTRNKLITVENEYCFSSFWSSLKTVFRIRTIFVRIRLFKLARSGSGS